MTDPKLTKTHVVIKYTSNDKYRYELTCKAGIGSKNLRTGEEVPPENALLASLEELARLTALFGFADEALDRFTKAQANVRDWREKIAS